MAIEGGKGKGGGPPHFLKKKINTGQIMFSFCLSPHMLYVVGGNENVFLNIHAEEIRLSFFS